MQDKEEWINMEFLVEVTYLKGGSTVWICVGNNDIEEKEDHKAIRLCGLYYNLFK